MPNHITTSITGPLEILDALTRTHTEAEREAYEAETEQIKQRLAERDGTTSWSRPPLDMTERIVDFALLIPEPENIERGGCSGRHDDGVVCWYEWNVSHWGTKWNGYSLEVTENDDTVELRFDTAWSHPFPVIEALSKKFPEADLEIGYADEDLGSNLSQYVIRDGEITQETEFTSENDELEFACQLKYGQSYAQLRKEWELDED